MSKLVITVMMIFVVERKSLCSLLKEDIAAAVCHGQQFWEWNIFCMKLHEAATDSYVVQNFGDGLLEAKNNSTIKPI
jgi:hypothetical protein